MCPILNPFFLTTDQLVNMFHWCKNKPSLCMFSMIAWPICVMSTFAELRQETFPSAPSLLLHLLSRPPSQYMVHVLLITTKSRSRPRASTFTAHMVWSSRLPALEIPLLTPTLKHPGPSRVCSGTCRTRGLQNASLPDSNPCRWLYADISTYKGRHLRYVHIHASSCIHSPGVFLIDSACSRKGLWWKRGGGGGGWGPVEGWGGFEAGATESEKEGWGIRPSELH